MDNIVRGISFTGICIDKGSKKIFCSSDNGRIYLVDFVRLQIFAVYQVHKSSLSAFTLIPGKSIATSS